MGRGEVRFLLEECCALAFACVSFCCSKCDLCGDVERVLEVGIAAAPFHGDVFRISITHKPRLDNFGCFGMKNCCMGHGGGDVVYLFRESFQEFRLSPIRAMVETTNCPVLDVRRLDCWNGLEEWRSGSSCGRSQRADCIAHVLLRTLCVTRRCIPVRAKI